MKKLAACFLSGWICISSLAGCTGQIGQAEGPGPELISADMLAQTVYDALQEEWDSYNDLSTEHRMLFSRIPGTCYEDFSDWEACEEFLGMPVPNPLEDAAWLEQGTYAGMPEGFLDAPHVKASLYGTREGHVEWLSIQSGYRAREIRITLESMLYSDPAEEKSPDSGWSVELARQFYLTNVNDDSAVITEDSGEQFVSRTAYLVQGHVLYRARVTGTPDQEGHIQETLEIVLSEFETA